MARGAGALITRGLAAAVDWFLPAAVRPPRGDERDRLRYRGYIRTSLGIFLGMLVILAQEAVSHGDLLRPEPLLWGIYALLMLANLLLVRTTGRAHAVNLANNFLGLLMMGALLHISGGIGSPYLPLFVGGIAVTANFGGNRAILAVMLSFAAMVGAVYAAQLQGAPWSAPPPDGHAHRFGLVMTAAALVLLGSLSAQTARTRTRTLLRRARDQAEARRLAAEVSHLQAEQALADLRDAQAHLVLQEKMASLGSLVAGVAHEVNTPVGVALTAASQMAAETARIRSLVETGALKRSDLAEYLEAAGELSRLVEANSARAARLIQSFKEVAVDQASGERRTFELGPYVEEVVSNLGPQLKRLRVRVAQDIPAGIVVDGYPGPFAQVLTNLVQNSLLHAFEEGRAGTITVEARRLGEAQVELTYRDDGKGIPAALRSRIFDPFFTTRRGQGGSGLGLHLLYNIVTGPMGGRVEVGEAPGGGARFTLSFPLVAPQPRAENRPEGVAAES
ncbi:MAG TPA: HAMP domain-containing sensor histidine kinase [Azospirillaceae bacterium]|nr:HAMP domain-containing sensor histidine kinase [Azospirillaceae bacterium]